MGNKKIYELAKELKNKGNLENNNVLSTGSLAKTGEATTILSSLLGALGLALAGLLKKVR